MPQSPEHPIEKQGPEETLEFLKRNEVRTMAKDVASLREEEAIKERKKIADIKTEPQTPPKESAPLMPVSSVPQETHWKLPKKPPHFDKVFIRVALILGITFILVNVAAFAVWRMKTPATQEITPTFPAPQELIELIESEDSSESERPERPTSLFPIEKTEIIEIQRPDQIVTSLTQFLQQDSEPGFTRILLKTQGRFLPLSEVLHGVNFIIMSELGESDALFLFVSGEQKRLGFAASLKDPQSAGELLKAQEKTFEQHAGPLLSIIGRKGAGYTTLFKTTSHKGVGIRFQTLSVRDFGIVYAIVKDTLVFTTSLQSMKQVIDQLVTP